MAAPTTAPTSVATATAPPTPSVTEGASSTPAATEDTTDDANGWWWLALAVVVAGGLVAFLLVSRGRRRQAWEAELATAETDTGWLARDLVPQLRGAGSTEELAGAWSVASPRLAALEDRLSRLLGSAPGQDQRTRATAMRDAVRAARERLTTLAGQPETGRTATLDEVQAHLLETLLPPAADPPADPPAAE